MAQVLGFSVPLSRAATTPHPFTCLSSHTSPTSHRWPSATTSPHGIDAVMAKVLYIDVIIRCVCGGSSKVKVGLGGLCRCQGPTPLTEFPSSSLPGP